MPLAYSTLGCPGDSLDQIIATAHAAGATGLELRAAAGEFVFPGMDDARSAALAGYVQVCAPGPDPGHGGDAGDPVLAELLAGIELAAKLSAGNGGAGA